MSDSAEPASPRGAGPRLPTPALPKPKGAVVLLRLARVGGIARASDAGPGRAVELPFTPVGSVGAVVYLRMALSLRDASRLPLPPGGRGRKLAARASPSASGSAAKGESQPDRYQTYQGTQAPVSRVACAALRSPAAAV